jgi:peroxiredoxin
MMACTRLIHRRILALLLVLGSAAGSIHIESALAAAGLVGKRPPDFALPAVAGSNVRLSEYRGQPVILVFWGGQCGSCEKQLTSIDRLYSTYRTSGLVVFGVSVDDDLVRAGTYAHAHPVSFPMLLDAAKGVARSFEIDRLPTTVMIDRSGTVRYLHAGDAFDERSYVAQIRALLDDDIAVP